MREKFQRFLLKYWFFIHLFFLVIYVAYMLYKVNYSTGVNPMDGKVENIASFNLPLFFMVLVGFLLMTLAALLKKINLMVQVLLLATGYILASAGFIKSLDPELDWENGDVPWGNYNAAREVNQLGISYVVKTWNDRANPALKSSFQEVNDSVAGVFQVYHLDWLTFNKWDKDTYPQGLAKDNNRPYMHPPFAPIFLSFWLKIFPFGKWSAEFLMILLSLVSFLYLVLVVFRKDIFVYNSDKIIMLALFTTPVMIIFPNPSAEQLSGLLFLLSVVLIIKPAKKIMLSYFMAGVLIGLTFYTKFNILFYIAVQAAYLIFKTKEFGYKPLLAYGAALLLIFLVFTLCGYYFWLTFITGFVYTKIYAINNPVGFVQGLSKLIYFGPALVLLFFLFISNKKAILDKSSVVILPVLISLLVLSLFLWDQGTWDRYLTFYLPTLGLFLLPAMRRFQFKTRDLLIVPIVNMAFLFMSLYF